MRDARCEVFAFESSATFLARPQRMARQRARAERLCTARGPLWLGAHLEHLPPGWLGIFTGALNGVVERGGK